MEPTSGDAPKIDYGKLSAEIIAIWQEESKENTLKSLAKSSRVSYSWIRQLKNHDVDTSLDTFYRLIIAMWPPNKVRNILLENTQHGAEVLVELEKMGVVFTDLEIDDLREATFVAKVVARERLSREEIEAACGKRNALKVLAKFEGFGLIVKNADESYSLCNKFQEIRSYAALKMLARLIIEFHDLAAGDDGETRIFGLNEKGIARASNAIRQFKIELIKILTDPENQGELVYGVTINSALI